MTRLGCHDNQYREAPRNVYVPLVLTVPGVGPLLAYTTGDTGLCPIVRQPGNRDVRGPLAKNGPKYLRWALPTPLVMSAIGSATSGTRNALVASVAPKLHGSTSPASWPRPSSMSSRRTNRLPRQAPRCSWSLDDPGMELGRRSSLLADLVLPAEGHREMSADRSVNQSLDPTTGAVVASGITAPDGTYSIAGLNSGQYEVCFVDPAGVFNVGYAGKNGTVDSVARAAVIKLGTTNQSGIDATLTRAKN